jgi:hypothetical protein
MTNIIRVTKESRMDRVIYMLFRTHGLDKNAYAQINLAGISMGGDI